MRHDRREVVRSVNLAGCVTLDRETRILRPHTLAIVFNPHLLLATKLYMNRKAPGAGVDRIFHEFLDDRGRALNDLPSGNLIRELGREPLDLPQRQIQCLARNIASIATTIMSM